MTLRLLVWCIAVLSFGAVAKLVELVTRPRERAARCGTFARKLAFVALWPGMDVGAFLEPLGEPRAPFVARKLSGGVAKLGFFLALLASGAALGLPERSFWLDHVFKLFEIYMAGSGGGDVVVGMVGLQGYRALDVFRWPIAASSVLDFWVRYNRHVNGWLKRQVFDRVGRRRVALAVLATFAASALLHELVFVVSVPSLVGRQTVFFLGHGVVGLGGAWAGRAWRRRTGRPVPLVLCHVLTLAFVVVSSVVFLSCFDAVVQVQREWGAPLLGLVRARLQSP